MKIKSRILLLASAATLLPVASASAQESGAGAIEEVVVTARKRDESLQDVPIAITAFTEAMARGETVLITAAAGGLGNVMTQLALAAGNHVVAVCGGERKAAWLESTGVQRVVNYRQEQLEDVIRSDYCDRLDLVMGIADTEVDAIQSVDFNSAIWQGTAFEGRTISNQPFAEGSSSEFAWSFAAGFKREIANRWALRLEYSFLNRGEGQTGINEDGDAVRFSDLESQQITLGLDWQF